MKKIMTLVVALACAATTFAQTPAVGSISIKPMVGLSLGTMSNWDNSKARTGFVAGAEAQYQLSDIFAISGGLLYTQQGAKGDSNSTTVTFKNDFLNIPVLLNAYVAPGLAVKLGVQPGVALSRKATGESGGASLSTDYFKDYFKTFDLAIPIGVSYEFSKVVLDARYNWGLLNQCSVDGNSTVYGTFLFTVGYRF